MNMDKYTIKAQEAVQEALKRVQRQGQQAIEPEHLLSGVMQVAEEVKRFFKGKVYATVVPRNTRLAEAPSHGKPVIAYDKWSKGAEAYRALAKEVLEG